MASQAAGIIGKFRAVKIDAPSESSGGGGAAPPAPAAAGARAPAAPAVAAKSLGTASLQELLAQITVLQQQQIAALAAAKKTQEDKLEADAKKQPANASEASMARKLAKETADLYAARRPLSNRLLSFAEQRKSVERNGSCVGSVSAMTVAPADDAKVSPGEVYEIAVSGVTVWPQVTVKGSATSEILVGPAVNQFVVRIKMAADAKGTVDVSISDRGLATEDIQLTIGAPAAK
jgi:hypothetical protein